jgi:hypothetical protein
MFSERGCFYPEESEEEEEGPDSKRT